MKKTAVFYIFFCLVFEASGQTIRKYSNEFLNIGVDAAAMGMGNTVTAHTADVNAVYWNPAGLLELKNKQLALMHAAYFANIAQYDYAAFAMPADSVSAIGVSLIRFGVDDILNTTQLIDSQGNIDYNRISLFSVADYAFTVSYARKTRVKNLTMGANAKVIRRIIGDFAASWGFGFDLGFQYSTAKKWKFGLMVRDITTTYNIWSVNQNQYQKIKDAIPTENQEMPETSEITLPKAQLGAAKHYSFNNEYSITATANLTMQFFRTNDLISNNSISIDPAVGFEADYLNIVFLRGGVGNFQQIIQIDNSQKLSFQPNFGIGFQYKGIQIDYALTDLGNQSTALYSNIFSLKIDFSVFK